MNTVKLPDDLCSPDQLSATILELNEYRGIVHDAQVRSAAGSKKGIETVEPTALLSSIAKASDIDLNDITVLDELRKQLETLLSKAPVANVTLAAVPSLIIKKRLVTWFRKEISPSMLLTFAARSDLGGGIVVQAGSHVYDFSFKRQLLANKSKIVEIASRVR